MAMWQVSQEISSLGVDSSIFKVRSEKDGLFYALRRVKKVRSVHQLRSLNHVVFKNKKLFD
jgi:hypothetical protein